MGTMREALVASMLRSFQIARLDLQARRDEELASWANRPPVWRWANGTFVFPEGLCCYCGGVMRSPCIWRAAHQQFYGSWKVVVGGDGVGRFDYDDSHPHVNAGSICMGGGNYRAQSIADVLFLAFNPTSSYFGSEIDPVTEEVMPTNTHIKRWFADRFDHRCGFKLDVKMAEGIDNRHLLAPEEGCHCQHCRRHRGEVQCPREGCREWYDPRQGHGRFRCETCNPSRTLHFCTKHKHEFRTCVACASHYDLWNYITGELDEEPYIRQCGECGEWICRDCPSECDDGSHAHFSDDDDDGDDEPEEHECCDCDVCCECGRDRDT